MPKPIMETYTIQAKLDVFTSIEIKASSLEEAVVEARKLQVPDFVEFNGDYIDGSIEITGVYK